MKLRLVGINEEAYYDSPKACPTPEPEPIEPEIVKRVVARLECMERGFFGSFTAPVEMVRGAEVGDEFTLFLERVRK